MQPLCFRTDSKRVAKRKKKSVWGMGRVEVKRYGTEFIPHTTGTLNLRHSGFRWSAVDIIPHLVWECQPQHSALW